MNKTPDSNSRDTLDVADLLRRNPFGEMASMSDAEWDMVPANYRHAIYSYVMRGTHPGDLEIELLSNNSMEAGYPAGATIAPHLARLARFIHMYVPKPARGGRAEVNAWMRSGGFEGRLAQSQNKWSLSDDGS